jgi:hypothetical protein
MRAVGVASVGCALAVLALLVGVRAYLDDCAFGDARNRDTKAREVARFEPSREAPYDFGGYVAYMRRFPDGRHAEEVLAILVDALGDFEWPGPYDTSLSPRGAWYAAGEALEEIGSPAVPALTAGLRHREMRARAYSAQALQQLGPDAHSAIPALVTAFENDPDEYVQMSCGQALWSLAGERKDIRAILERAAGNRPWVRDLWEH